MPAIPILTSLVKYFLMISYVFFLFVSILFKFSDGGIDVCLLAILEGDNKGIFELRSDFSFGA